MMGGASAPYQSAAWPTRGPATFYSPTQVNIRMVGTEGIDWFSLNNRYLGAGMSGYGQGSMFGSSWASNNGFNGYSQFNQGWQQQNQQIDTTSLLSYLMKMVQTPTQRRRVSSTHTQVIAAPPAPPPPPKPVLKPLPLPVPVTEPIPLPVPVPLPPPIPPTPTVVAIPPVSTSIEPVQVALNVLFPVHGNRTWTLLTDSFDKFMNGDPNTGATGFIKFFTDDNHKWLFDQGGQTVSRFILHKGQGQGLTAKGFEFPHAIANDLFKRGAAAIPTYQDFLNRLYAYISDTTRTVDPPPELVETNQYF